jgi:predicted dehydrogenase
MVEKLRYGAVGGADGSFIGAVHRKGATFDGFAELVAGCFSRNEEKNKNAGAELGIPADRVYLNYLEMAEKESKRPDGIDFVSIATPNNSHYEIAKAFLEHGIHVACDKPFTFTSAQSKELAELAVKKGLLILITYTYTGYPMIKQARKMIADGEIGEIIMVNAEYVQPGMTKPGMLELRAPKRGNPEIFGPSNAMSDIGTHIEAAVRVMTGLQIKKVSAKMDHFGKICRDTNDIAMLEYENGASGVYWATQLAIGYNNGFKIRIFGTKGTIEWFQEDPNHLKVAYLGKPVCVIASGSDYTPAETGWRLPAGHSEGFYEAFADLYTPFEKAILKIKKSEKPDKSDLDFTNAMSGYYGMRLVEACLNSVEKGGVWVEY